MASATPTLSFEIGAVFVVAFVVLGALYALNRYLKRRGPELATREGRGVLDDRSFNQIRIGQAAAEVLARSGADVTAARMLLTRAETARTSGAYDMAIELAKQAQDRLSVARSGAQTLVAAPSSRSEPRAAVDSPSSRSAWVPPTRPSALHSTLTSTAAADPVRGTLAPAASLAGMPSSRPPKNKMEAHFQLSLATEELERFSTTKPPSKNIGEADRLRVDGQAAYDRGDFTEALRLALRSRRTLGTRVEALPVATAPGSASAGTGSAALPRGPGQGAAATEELAFGPKCPQCGKPATADDRYCRSCGGPIPPSLCSSCAAPLSAGDRFCGVCGAVQA
ncbi:MAG: zinc ribbon domain-containing protein [Thermoplasmata archaeon]|nr:zinc ribbon domain-containing protein [Thermoplasmata archaeon]